MAGRVAHHYPRKDSIMAIIRSLAVGKARKSAGNLTYRTVRGRTIASEKVGERPITRAPGEPMTKATYMFACLNRYMAAHKSDIEVSFDKTKYGSQRNYFAKLNYYGISSSLESLYASKPDADQVTDTEIEEAVADYAQSNPTAIYRVKRAGYDTVYLDGAWDSADNPTPPADLATYASMTIDGKSVQQLGGTDSFSSGDPVVISGTNLDNGRIKITLSLTDESPVDPSQALNNAVITNTQITGTSKISSPSSGQVYVKVYDDSRVLFEDTLEYGLG